VEENPVNREAPAPGQETQASRSQAHTLALLAITLAALYLCFRMLAPFLPAFAWALALAVLAMPLQRQLERHFRSRNLATAVSIAAAAVVVVLPLVLVSVSLVDEVISVAGGVQDQVESGAWRERVAAQPQLTWIANWMERELDVPGTVRAASGTLTELAGSVVKGSLQQAVEILLTFYLLFYFLRDRNQALDAIARLSPLSVAQMEQLYRRIGESLHATLYGTFVVALVQGMLGGLMFWMLDLPAPLLWGVVMGLLAIVPVLGAFLIWIPAALFLLLSGHPLQALLLTVWGGVVVGGIDNLLYPMLVGTRLHLHTVTVLVSVVGGVLVFGAAGLILGPLVLTATGILLQACVAPA
jgi:predicted PurR-regulated permease PerM